MSASIMRRWWLSSALAMLTACASTQTPKTAAPEAAKAEPTASVPEAPPKEEPPPSGPMRDIQFPPRQSFTLDNGLTVDVVRQPSLPIVQMQLVVTSGRAQDPEKKPGVAAMVAEMLTLGTRKRSAEAFAEAIEFLGADLSVWEEADAVRLSMRALSEHLDPALDLLADATLNPAFGPAELNKLRRRELNRLKLSSQEAGYLASREFHRAIYGEHPYAHVDTTAPVLKKLSRADLVRWHRSYFAPNNAFLVVVGDVTVEEVQKAVKESLGRWKKRKVTEEPYPEVPERKQRRILVVDRPESVQSVIYIGSPGVRRNDEDFIPLKVANQVLGGSAASRLFMDLREKRSLTYGAYSTFDEDVDVGTFKASASVRNAVTEEAVGAFLEHLERIVQEPIPPEEVESAHRYLADSFPLKIETAGRVADLVADLRLFGLPADYWDTYRTQIREVDAAEAHAAAEQHIDPQSMLILVVGKAAEIVPGLRKFGDVEVIDTKGNPVTEFEQKPVAGDQSSTSSNAENEADSQPAADEKKKPETKAKPEGGAKPQTKAQPDEEKKPGAKQKPQAKKVTGAEAEAGAPGKSKPATKASARPAEPAAQTP